MNTETKYTSSPTPTQIKVLKAIKYSGINTRTALCKYLNLSRSTVTTLVGDMIEAKMIFENGVAVNAQTKGRNPSILMLNESYRLIIGITIEHDNLQVVLTMMNGDCVHKTSQPLDLPTYHELLSLIVKLVEDLMTSNLLKTERILGIGIAISERAQELIEGADKLTRIKKDLSFAINYKIATMPLRPALLMAYCIFHTPQDYAGTVALIRLSRSHCFDYMLDGIVSRPKIARAPLFDEVDLSTKTGLSEFATAINQYDKALSPAKIFLMGEISPTISIEDLNHTIEEMFKQKTLIEPYFIKEIDIAKAGCGIILNDVFKII